MAGSVRRHPEGGWIADVTVRGCRRTRRAATKALATQAKADLVRELEERPGQARPASTGFTLADARRLSLQVRWAGLAWERTAAIYSQQACDFLGADLPVTEVTAAQVEAWRQSYLNAGSRPATVNKRVSCLRAMLADAALHGHLPTVPALPRQLKSRNGRERVLTGDERDRILAALLQMGQPMVADLIEFMLETGCRTSEALKARGQDVSLLGRTVSFWETKNGRNRTVPLTARCVDVLRGNLPAVPSRRVFPIEYAALRNIWQRAKLAAGVEDDALVLHSLRHTCATRLARGGVSLHQLQAWGGWSSPAACQRYLHHSVESLGVCVSVLEGK
jgi:integrase